MWLYHKDCTRSRFCRVTFIMSSRKKTAAGSYGLDGALPCQFWLDNSCDTELREFKESEGELPSAMNLSASIRYSSDSCCNNLNEVSKLVHEYTTISIKKHGYLMSAKSSSRRHTATQSTVHMVHSISSLVGSLREDSKIPAFSSK